MPETKNPLIRYQVLDKCLRSTSRNYSAKDLLNEVNQELELRFGSGSSGSRIGKVQLHSDLENLREIYNAEIITRNAPSDARIKLYSYANPKYSINNQPLSELEANRIQDAIQILGRFQGLPQFEQVNEIIPALQDRFGSQRSSAKSNIEFASNKYLEGLEHLTSIYDAVANRRVLKVTYQDFNSPEPYDLIIHPYYLKQFNNRWFLFGKNAALNVDYWNLSIDRVKTIEETTLPFEESSIDWSSYFDDVIGVTKRDSQIEIIELLFPPKQAPYIMTKPLHETQKKKYNDERGLLVTIEVIPNYELETLLLSFGDKVTVLSPSHLQYRIKERLQNAITNYTN